MTTRPHYDIVIVGEGTAGCVLAARLSVDRQRTVCLVEAGLDYGSFDHGGWPGDLLEPRALSSSHDWGPSAAMSLSWPQRTAQLAEHFPAEERLRVMSALPATSDTHAQLVAMGF